ncbi:MAG: hypothetical protein HZB38_03205 [Planctomycetes bacterium]|nr:hypothetical protein [Planctomycetota bacterium]
MILISWAIYLETSQAHGQECNPMWTGAGTERGYVLAVQRFHDGAADRLFVGGLSLTRYNAATHRVAHWDGHEWTSLSGPTGFVSSLGVFDLGAGPRLYAGGSSNVYRWDGSVFFPLFPGVSFGASAMAVFDQGNGSEFFFVRESGYVYRWDGVWLPAEIGRFTPANIVPNALAVFDDGSGPALYMGGWFSTVTWGGTNSIAAGGVARWNGAQWTSVGGGMTGPTAGFNVAGVERLIVWDDGGGAALYAAGAFEFADGNAASSFARWNGIEWLPVGAATARQREVAAMRVLDLGDGPALYIAGDFRDFAGIGAHNLAKWNGVTWSAVHDATTATGRPIYDLAVYPDAFGTNSLYLGGDFTGIGGFSAPFGIARLVCDCPDLNHDGVVDLSDLSGLLAEFGRTTYATFERGDVNSDGRVDIQDLANLLGRFGTACP